MSTTSNCWEATNSTRATSKASAWKDAILLPMRPITATSPVPASLSATTRSRLRSGSRLVSFFGRANYNFSERYYLTGVLRYDGSSRFGANNKWALFPALSASWRLSEEPFLQDVDVLSDLRIRVGYGVNGNQDIGNRRSLALLTANAGAAAVLGDAEVTGVTLAAYANPNLKWEQAVQYNVGLDYGFLDGKYSGTIEYFLKNTEDLLLEIPVPQPAPIPVRLENIGEIRNQGVEFSLDALFIDRPDVSWISGLVASAERNEVVSLGSRDRIVTGDVSGRGQSGTQAQIILPGFAVPSFYAPVYAGPVRRRDWAQRAGLRRA